jgi:1-aminocyclopropane-1-carboxylate deaminase
VLKGDGWENEVEKFEPGFSNWRLVGDYHCGGYAKATPALRKFIEEFSSRHFPIENVYSGKLFYGIFDLVSKGYFGVGSKIMAIHTGGIHPS